MRFALLRKMARARALVDAAHDYQAVAGELFCEAGRLVDEIKAEEAGRPVLRSWVSPY